MHKWMRYLIGTLSTLLLSAQLALAGYPPDIYAICRVSLNSGKNITGVVEISKVGECGYYPNGLAFKTTSGQYIIKLFDLSGSFEFNTHRFDSIFYLENETYGCDDSELSKEITSANGVIREQVTRTNRYKLLTELPLYSDIDLNGRPLKTSISNIKISIIKSFEMLSDPDEKWITLISKRKQELELEIKNNPGDWSPDLFEPIWFHQLSDSDKNELLKTFYR